MSGTTTGGGIPHDEVILTDPKTGKQCTVAKSDVADWRDGLAEEHPVRSLLREFLKEESTPPAGGDDLAAADPPESEPPQQG